MVETHTDSKQNLDKLKAILFLLQKELESLSTEVDRSYELLNIGETTEFVQGLMQSLDDPIGSILKSSSEINEQVRTILDRIVKVFLERNSAIIYKAYRSKTATDSLHYCIVLKEDNVENRGKVFEFLDTLDTLDLSENFPITFQFIPTEDQDKIKVIEELKV